MTGTANKRNRSYIIPVFLLLWFILNLLQSFFTGLANDEAYYWMYSRQPAWGYFDHPPMVALLIRAGSFLLPDELGVRILFCLLGTLTLWLIWKIFPLYPRIFILIVSATALVHSHVAGFLAIPDIPLVFFTALFFCGYKQYRAKVTAGRVLWLSLSMAGMFYSKYHGLLVVIFVLLSDLSLLKRKSAWVVVGLAALAMVPHLVWQIRYGFPTFRYHLVTRPDGFELENIFNYLYSQVLIAGPLIAPLILYHSFSYKPKDQLERSLMFTWIGFLVFFFLSSFRDHMEAHWTAAAYVALIVLAQASIGPNPLAMKWLRRLAIPSAVLLLGLRFIVAFDLIPYPLKFLDEFNGWKEWAATVNGKAGGKEVIFINKYQFAAKYSFYTGDISCSVSDVFARKSQYDLWHFEDSLAGKPVMLNKSLQPEGMIKTPNRREYGYSYRESFQPYNRIRTEVALLPVTLKAEDTLDLHCTLFNDESYTLHFDTTCRFRPVLCCTICRKNGTFYQQPVPVHEFDYRVLPPMTSAAFDFRFVTPRIPGDYVLYVVFRMPDAGQWGNPKPAAFRVTPR